MLSPAPLQNMNPLVLCRADNPQARSSANAVWRSPPEKVRAWWNGSDACEVLCREGHCIVADDVVTWHVQRDKDIAWLVRVAGC